MNRTSKAARITFLAPLLGPAVSMGVIAALGACTTTHNGDDTSTPTVTSGIDPVEFVGYHNEVALDPTQFHALASGLFGTDAQGGKILPEQTLAPGLFVDAAADQQTPDQVDLTFSFDDGTPTHRKIAMAPASFSIGSIFVKTVDAALAKMQADNAPVNGKTVTGQGESYFLEYRMYSSQGGRVSFGVRGDGGAYTLVIDVTSPHMSLTPGQLNTAADHDGPYDTVAGTVWFHMSKDDFDFFVNHAYGEGATGKQNFKDFELVPHNWLHLTVTPHLDQQFVNVSFNVIGTDGSSTAFANAPASVPAGTTFQNAVDRNMTNTINQEKVKAGTSTPWSVPFYYDSPNQGGIVQVIAQGAPGGVFTVAYGVETPHHALKDVPLVQYEPVTIPPDDGAANASCVQLGGTEAPKGTLNLTFSASTQVVSSPDLHVPLKGPVSCSVYHASDVTVEGPSANAVSVQDFAIQNMDLTATPAPTFVTNEVFAGDYQVLCFMDLNGNNIADPGDPVTLPIGSDPVECAANPTTVQFAILYPVGGGG